MSPREGFALNHNITLRVAARWDCTEVADQLDGVIGKASFKIKGHDSRDTLEAAPASCTKYYLRLEVFRERRTEGKHFEGGNRSLTVYSVPSWETTANIHFDEASSTSPALWSAWDSQSIPTEASWSSSSQTLTRPPRGGGKGGKGGGRTTRGGSDEGPSKAWAEGSRDIRHH